MIGRYCSATSGSPQGSATLEVLIAALTEASIAAPIVSNDQRSRRDGALDEPTERLGATVEHDGEPNASGLSVRLSGCRAWCPAFDDAPRWHRRREPCGEHHGLPNAFARQPRFRPPQHGSWAVHRSCLGWAAPCPSGACGEFERPSRSAKDLAAETARRTCRASDWRPDKRPRTRLFSGVWLRSITVPTVSPVLAALAAAQDARAVFKVDGGSRRAAVRAGKAVSPAGFLQVGGAGRIIGEKSLELGLCGNGRSEYPWRAPLYYLRPLKFMII